MNFIRIRNFKGAICQQHRFYTAQPVSWTNAGLKRLRKAQLESLAREHKLNSEGTKAQLIARLLNHPKEPEMQQQIEEFEATEASHAHPVNDNVEREMMQEVQQEVAGRTGITSRHSHENELEAANWIEAFELKVNQRRTRDRRAGSFFPGNKRDITAQAALDSSAVAPPTEETQKKGGEPAAFATNDATITPEDMDVEWVKAFEQKAMNRAFRKRDTFIATDTRIDSVLQPQAEVVSERQLASADIQDALFTVVPPSSPETDKVKAAAGSESSSSPKTDTERGSSRAPDANHEQSSSSPEPISSTRNRLINIVVASSLAVWVTSGEEGFRKLLDIFAGSP